MNASYIRTRITRPLEEMYFNFCTRIYTYHDKEGVHNFANVVHTTPQIAGLIHLIEQLHPINPSLAVVKRSTFYTHWWFFPTLPLKHNNQSGEKPLGAPCGNHQSHSQILSMVLGTGNMKLYQTCIQVSHKTRVYG